MPLYTFNLCRTDGLSVIFEFYELPADSDAVVKASELLGRHLSADHVEVWDDDRPVATQYRVEPIVIAIAKA